MPKRRGSTKARRQAVFVTFTVVLLVGLALAVPDGRLPGGSLSGSNLPGGDSSGESLPGGFLDRLGAALRRLGPAASPDSRSRGILREVDSFVAGLEALLDELDDIGDGDLAIAEAPGQPDHARCLERTRAIRDNRTALAGLREEVSTAGAELGRLTAQIGAAGENLDGDTCHSVETTLNALRAGRLTLRDTAGDITREVAEMALERAAHNWAGVTGRVETIRAIQEVRLEELQNILNHLQSLQRLLR